MRNEAPGSRQGATSPGWHKWLDVVREFQETEPISAKLSRIVIRQQEWSPKPDPTPVTLSSPYKSVTYDGDQDKDTLPLRPKRTITFWPGNAADWFAALGVTLSKPMHENSNAIGNGLTEMYPAFCGNTLQCGTNRRSNSP
jgi:hypothetical protein